MRFGVRNLSSFSYWREMTKIGAKIIAGRGGERRRRANLRVRERRGRLRGRERRRQARSHKPQQEKVFLHKRCTKQFLPYLSVIKSMEVFRTQGYIGMNMCNWGHLIDLRGHISASQTPKQTSNAIAASWVLRAIALLFKLWGNNPHTMFQEGGDRGRVGVVEGGQCGEEFKQEDFQGQEEVKMDDKGLDLYSCMSLLSFLFWSEV